MFRRTRMGLLILPAAIASVTAGCGHKGTAADDEGGPSAARAEVTLTHVVRTDISQTLALTGTTAALPNQDVRVSSLVPGRIVSLTVAEGDRVESGEILAKLDDRPYRDQLEQAEAVAAQAKASFENAKLSRTRNEDLFQRGIAARKDLEDARTQESVAAAAVRQSEAALHLARLQLGRTEIVSPLNGQIAKRFVSDGEQVDGTAAQPIVEVANLRELEFIGNVPAMYLAKLHPGESVNVTTEAAARQNFPGRVVGVSPVVDPATGVGVVRIRVPNTGGLLRLGMFLNALIPIETHAHALTVPPEAIYRNESGEPRVFVVDGDSATGAPVKIGIEAKEQVELLSGVKEGETVILTGGYGLGDKARVQARPDSNSPSNPDSTQ
jgi:RND family efflux transporter MFP subunit